MGDDGEPPDDSGYIQNISKLVETIRHQDTNGILLRPDIQRGIIGRCNATVLGEHMGYRERIKAPNKYGEVATGIYQRIENGDPRKPVGESRRILIPNEEYDADGCEDLRFSNGEGTNFITYVGFKEGQKGGARIALATTDDFKKIHKYGVIGPQIKLREAAKLFKGTSYENKYGSIVGGFSAKQDPFLMDKDPSLMRMNGEYWLFHRIEPDIWLTKVKNLEDLTNHEFWREELKTADDHVILRAPEGIIKYGLGDTPKWIDGRLIASAHQVTGSEGSFLNWLNYKSFLMELDPKTGRVIKKMGSTIPCCEQTKYLKEFAGEGPMKTLVTMKAVEFGEGFAISPENPDTIIITYGKDDKELWYRTTSKTHVFRDLDHPLNRIAA